MTEPRLGGPPANDFGDVGRELEAALDAAALLDRSELARLIATGRDLLDLLHRLSTADLKGLAPGEGRETVLTSPKGRIVERLFVHHLGDAGVLLIAGPGRATAVLEHLRRYTFREETGLADATGTMAQLAVVGPAAREAIAGAGLPYPDALRAERAELGGTPVHVLGEDGGAREGVSVLVPAERAREAWDRLAGAVERAGGRPAGAAAAEAWRVLRGHPASGRELTEEFNPLEAGLRDAVSFTKGCYVGQEVVARLNTYDKVSRRLVGFRFPPEIPRPEVGAGLVLGERRVGALTSVVELPGGRGAVALAYLKRDVAAAPVRLEAPGEPVEASPLELPLEVAR